MKTELTEDELELIQLAVEEWKDGKMKCDVALHVIDSVLNPGDIDEEDMAWALEHLRNNKT